VSCYQPLCFALKLSVSHWKISGRGVDFFFTFRTALVTTHIYIYGLKAAGASNCSSGG
jgi:hypothetical protein